MSWDGQLPGTKSHCAWLSWGRVARFVAAITHKGRERERGAWKRKKKKKCRHRRHQKLPPMAAHSRERAIHQKNHDSRPIRVIQCAIHAQK